MKLLKANYIVIPILFTIFSIILSHSVQAEPADMVFIGGKIYTVNPDNPWAEAIAVNNGEIIYVGDEDGAQSYIGFNTKKINLDDKLLLPGFIDTHVHPVLASLFMNSLAFNEEDDLKAIYQKLTSYANDHPEEIFIMGHGYNHKIFKEDPTSKMLDNIIADRAVFLIDSGGHMGWGNTKAFEMANITAKTPDPVPSSHYYIRDEFGKPTGYMYEEETFTPFAMLGKDYALKEIKANSADIFYLMNSFGVTSVFDASMEWFLYEGLQVMGELENKSKLPLRMVASMTLERDSTPEQSINQYHALKNKYNSNKLRVGAIKVSLDGTLEGKSAALLNNYLHGGSGALNWQPEAFTKTFVALDKRGVDFHLHAIGDRAVNEALNAIEAARKANGFHGTRHTICHTQLVQDSDIPRFKSLDVIAQTTPVWHSEMPGLDWREIDDKEREKLFPFKTLSQSGARVTFGSDFPFGGGLEALVPAYNIEVGHTRVWPGNNDANPLTKASEKLDLKTLIKGYTLDAAYQLRMESIIGSIEVGKRADLIILEENLFDISSEDIHDINVEMTMVDGRIVYERPFYQWLLEWWLEI